MDAMPLNLARPEVPVEVAAIVAKMMAKEPEHRFQTPAEVARALTRFFNKANLGARVASSQATQPSTHEALMEHGVTRYNPEAIPEDQRSRRS
ncbi:MAG: hypothetical protein ACLQVF_37925 [Isosphaeraceae bacterium]